MTTTAKIQAHENEAAHIHGRQGDDRIETSADTFLEDEAFDVLIFLDGKLDEDCFIFGNQAPSSLGAGMNSLPHGLGEDSL